jgi:hypothetical protein
MATRTWIGSASSSNWGTSTNWVENAVPTSADDVVISAITITGITINVAATCLSINFTNFGSRTLIFNQNLTLSSGGMTLISAMTITSSGGYGLVSNTNHTITSNGKIFGENVFSSASHTITLTDNFYCKSLYCRQSGTNLTLSGNTVYVSGNLGQMSTSEGGFSQASTNSIYILGTSDIVMNGTGVINFSPAAGNTAGISNNLTINSTGAVTMTQMRMSANKTFRYVAASNPAIGGQLTLASAMSIDTNVASIGSIQSVAGAGVLTLLSNLICTGSVTLPNGPTSVGGTGYNWYIGGSFSVQQSMTIIPNVIFNGTGTISVASALNVLTADFEINTTGTTTIGTLFNAGGNGGSFTVTTPSNVSAPIGSQLILGQAISAGNSYLLDTNGAQFNTVTINPSIAGIFILNNSLLKATTLSIPNTALSFTLSGTSGFDVTNLSITKTTTAALNVTLTYGNTYIVRGGTLTMAGTSAVIKPVIQSSDATNKVVLNLLEAAACRINWATAARIDSGAGNPIISTNSVRASTINWGESSGFFFFF